jgi:serine/threonine protein kinase
MSARRLKSRQRIGKYVVEKRISEGGFAMVYQARDTIEGQRVALKIPHQELMDSAAIEQFQREARLVAKLDHPNILPLKTADLIDGRFVIVTALAKESLGDRIERRLAAKTALSYVDQMLAALEYSHERSIAHCDIKPDNFLLFADGRLRLADFGISRVAQHTLRASGAGTIGYVAPEQAMGSPSLRSDVFSLGLTLYRLFAGTLPSWPYLWPMRGADRLQRVLHPKMIEIIRRSLVRCAPRFSEFDRAHWRRVLAKYRCHRERRRAIDH